VIEAFSIQLLGDHDRKTFTCGDPALDRYFRTQVGQDIRRRVSNCFVAIAPSGEVAAFHTFASATLPLSDVGTAEAKRLPRYPAVPAALIGRLAVDERHQGRRLGGALIFDAVARAAGADAMIYALIVDAKNEAAAGFYRHLGFQRFSSRPMSLFLPLRQALQALAEPTD
jgi:ribosomal protein S18 acetylase RimI-like enzyme